MTTKRPAHQSNYRRLAQLLRDQTLRGEFAEGRPLPTETQLAAEHGLSRQTVRRAYQELVAEGLVYRVAGRGTFASQPERPYLRQFGSVEDLMGLSVDTEFRLIEPLQDRVDLSAAGRLRLESDVVSVVTFARAHEEVPFCVTSVYLPPAIGRLFLDTPVLTTPGSTSNVTVIGLLEQQLESPIAEGDQSITVELASPAHAQALDCAVGQPLLRIDRVYYDTEGNAVELAVSHFLPEKYSYRVRLRRTTV
jgi:GntR family transcriptional regulator